MSHSNLQKKRSKYKPPAHERSREENDAAILSLINGINNLIAKANHHDMGTAARIFHQAREELVHWAVEMNFHESAEERFLNSQLYCERTTQAIMLDSFMRVLEQAVHRCEQADGLSKAASKNEHVKTRAEP